MLRLTSSLELASEHPLAEAIVRGAEAKGIELVKADNFQSVTGKGVTGDVDGHTVAAGNAALLESLGISAGDLSQQADKQRGEGQTLMLIAIDGKAAGLIGVADLHHGVERQKESFGSKRTGGKMTAVIDIFHRDYDAVLFDLDGVLTRTASVHAVGGGRHSLSGDLPRRRLQSAPHRHRRPRCRE